MNIDFLNILYLVLSVCAIIITVFLVIFLIRGIIFLGNLNKISNALNSMIDMANAFILKPLQILEFIIEFFGKYLGNNSSEKKSEKNFSENEK